MQTLQALFSQPLDVTLTQWVTLYGVWMLGIVAIIIFCETGLVVTPFLPGDSLLFLTGTVAAAASMNVHLAVGVLIAAAILGDATNFAIGRRAAPWVLKHFKGRWLKQEHLDATNRYFDRFGGSTIVVARFIPIVRTLAPFLAGAGEMAYVRFALFNVVGAIVWVGSLVYLGAFLGSRPFVQDNLTAIMVGIVIVSVLPAIWGYFRARREEAPHATAKGAIRQDR